MLHTRFAYFGLVIVLSFLVKFKAQESNVAILLNEYCATNIQGPADNYGQLSDWVEIRNAHTSSVTLNGYYLSNDRNNLFKWPFPSNFNLGVNELGVVWLSGKGTSDKNGYHANFSLDQCKNQWLILTNALGVVRDSIFIQTTKAGHSRGRIMKDVSGISAWKLFTTPSYMQPNGIIGQYTDYLPKPKLFSANSTQTIAPGAYTAQINTGGFFTEGAQNLYVKFMGQTYDTAAYPCIDIFYTTNGDYPVPGAASTTQYFDSLSSFIVLGNTSLVRIIAAPNLTRAAACSDLSNYLESFCESNTYFIDPAHQNFSKQFGVLSLSINKADSAWFISNGNPPSTTVHVEYYDAFKQVTEGYAIINRPPNEEWRTVQRGYYISIDDRYGFGCNFDGPVFNVAALGTSSRSVFPTLHLKGGDIESHSAPNAVVTVTSYATGLRDVFYQSLAAKHNLRVNPLHIKPVITFVNGKYWGVYNLTEVFDKYYEQFYNAQSKDSLDMCFYHNGDGIVTYPDGSASTFSNNFRTAVYDVVMTKPMNSSLPGSYYASVMKHLDRGSFIDYMILNSYGMNADIWNYNVALAKGGQTGKPGDKWHYYLWNMPTVFNYTVPAGIGLPTNTLSYFNADVSPCAIHSSTIPISAMALNAHGNLLWKFMNSTTGNPAFKLEYRNRYQDLMNGPLSCTSILKHFDTIDSLYLSEMRCHEDPGCAAGPGVFITEMNLWDSNMVKLRNAVARRCDIVANYFKKPGCYGVYGPYPVVVDVYPSGAGKVKLNSLELDKFKWIGNYYSTTMSFKAIPASSRYKFHHWEFKNHTPMDPNTNDSLAIQFYTQDDVLAVFTDTQGDVSNTASSNIPNGFTPNGDGLNDYFKPLGSGLYVSDYQIVIWNRWGQEVYASQNPESSGWDGNFKGSMAPTGVYAYVLTFRDGNGETKTLSGNVTLTR